MTDELLYALPRRNSEPETLLPELHHVKEWQDTLQHYAFAHRGAPYPISEEGLQILQSKNFKHTDKRWRGLPLSVELKGAHKALHTFLRSSWTQKQREARWRLLEAYNRPEEYQTPDLFIKVFNDVDLVLFGGVLRNRVRIRWDTISSDDLDAGNLYWGCSWDARWLHQHIERTSVVLNAAVDIRQCQREFWWGTLIHEMLHAYIGILTAGYQDDNSRHARRYPYDVSHGPMFEKASNALAWRLAFPELIGHDVCGFGDGTMGWIVPQGHDDVKGLVRFGKKPEGLEEAVEVSEWTAEMGTLKGRRRHSI